MRGAHGRSQTMGSQTGIAASPEARVDKVFTVRRVEAST